MTITTTHLIKFLVTSAGFLRHPLRSRFSVVFTLDISLDVHVASAEEADSSVKLTARKVSGDVKASRRLFKKLLNRGRQRTRSAYMRRRSTPIKRRATYDPKRESSGTRLYSAQDEAVQARGEPRSALCVRVNQIRSRGAVIKTSGALLSRRGQRGAARLR